MLHIISLTGTKEVIEMLLKRKLNATSLSTDIHSLTWLVLVLTHCRYELKLLGVTSSPWWAELTWQVSSCCSTLSCMVSEPAAPAATRLLWAFCSHSSSWPTLSRHTWRTPSLGRDPAERGSSGAWDTNTTHPAEPLCSRVTDTEHGGREEGAELSL